MSKIITEILKDVKLKKVQIKLSKDHVKMGVPKSGLWPRITLEKSGKSKTIPMTWYLDAKANKDYKIQVEVIRFAGAKRIELAYQDRYDLAKISANIRKRIELAMKKATNKGTVAKRQQAAQRKIRKTLFLEKLKRFCENEGKALQYEDLKPADFGEVWDEVRKMRVAQEIMES